MGSQHDIVAVLADVLCDGHPTPASGATTLRPADFPLGEQRLAALAVERGADP